MNLSKEIKTKAYKGFNKDLQCVGGDEPFQYEIGKTYEEDNADLCRAGFHACEAPLDVFGYYPPCDNSRYCEVELDGVSDQVDTDSKRAGKKITIGAEIGIPGLVKAHVEYVKAHTTTEHTDPKTATAGDNGAATAGSCGAATSRGSASTGKYGLSVVRGDNVKAKGGLGAIIVIAFENRTDYNIKEWKVGVIDGETLKADTWYTLKDGKFFEVEENE